MRRLFSKKIVETKIITTFNSGKLVDGARATFMLNYADGTKGFDTVFLSSPQYKKYFKKLASN